jgi:hypothetical protein
MDPAEGPAPGERAQQRSAPHNASAPGGRAAAPASWIDEETPISSLMWSTLKRLVRRARASGPVWIALAVLISGGVLWRQINARQYYEVTVIVRVSDGAVGTNGAALNGGALRGYIDEVAFTAANLTTLIQRHPSEFPDLTKDVVAALTQLHENMTVFLGDDEFLDERGPNDPPRAAHIIIDYRAGDPDAAWDIAHELSELLVGSTVAGQKADLEREAAVAAVALQRSQADLTQLLRGAEKGEAKAIEAARERWRTAQAADVAAQLALRAAAGRQTLRFDVVSPGRKPEVVNRTAALTTGFVTMLLVMLLAAGLLAGAFDPRVLEAGDLVPSGLGLLGSFPSLPVEAPFGEGGAAGRRV